MELAQNLVFRVSHHLSEIKKSITVDDHETLHNYIQELGDPAFKHIFQNEGKPLFARCLFSAGCLHVLWDRAITTLGIDYLFNSITSNQLSESCKYYLNHVDPVKGTILHQLIRIYGTNVYPFNSEIVRVLFKLGVKADIFNSYGLTAVHYIIYYGKLEWLSHVLKQFPDFDVNIRGSNESMYMATLIDCAAAKSYDSIQYEMLMYLFDKGAVIPPQSPCISILCHLSLQTAEMKVLQILLEKGADPNVPYPGNDVMPKIFIAPYKEPHKASYLDHKFAPTTAIGSLASVSNTDTKRKELIELLRRNKATLSQKEIIYYLGCSGLGHEVAIKQINDNKIEPRIKQSFAITMPLIWTICNSLDGYSLKTILQTCSLIKSEVDTDKFWKAILDRDYPGETNIFSSNYKYRYAHWYTKGAPTKCQLPRTLSFVDNGCHQGKWAGQNQIFELCTLSIKNNTFILEILHKGRSRVYCQGNIEKIETNNHLLLTGVISRVNIMAPLYSVQPGIVLLDLRYLTAAGLTTAPTALLKIPSLSSSPPVLHL